MFDIGFSELLVIGIVALVVLGPERLPRVARTAGHLFGRLQRYVADVKADINREIHLEELKKMQEEMRASVNSMEQSVSQAMQQGDAAVREAAEQIHEIVELPRPPVTPDSVEAPAPEEMPSPQLELSLDGAANEPDPKRVIRHE